MSPFPMVQAELPEPPIQLPACNRPEAEVPIQLCPARPVKKALPETVRAVLEAAPDEVTVNWLLLPTVRRAEGELVPIPTFPSGKTVNSWFPLEEATAKGLTVGALEVPWTKRVAAGVIVPIPTSPPEGFKVSDSNNELFLVSIIPRLLASS